MVSVLEEKNLHHAIALVGDVSEQKIRLKTFLGKLVGENISSHPDVWWEVFDIFTVEDARALRTRQAMKPIAGDKKYLVVETTRLTLEAQNALLKVLEEPSPGTHIFLLLPNLSGILPTVISRLQIEQAVAREEGSASSDIAEFVRMKPAERLQADFIVTLIKDKNRSGAYDFLVSLERYIYEQREAGAQLTKEQQDILKHLAQMRDYVLDTGSSVKLILESVCVLV